jgi:hypothetical protein
VKWDRILGLPDPHEEASTCREEVLLMAFQNAEQESKIGNADGKESDSPGGELPFNSAKNS